jgi:hypothetical protein
MDVEGQDLNGNKTSDSQEPLCRSGNDVILEAVEDGR